MKRPIFTNRPKEDEPTYFAHMSEDELKEHLATIDFAGLQQLRLEMFGSYGSPVTTLEEVRSSIVIWCATRQLEREGFLEQLTDKQGNLLYREGQRVFGMTPMGAKFCSEQKEFN